MQPISESRKIGEHSVAYEPDTGFFLMNQVGVLNEHDASEILAAFDALNAAGTAPYVLCATSHAGSITPEARQVFQRARQSSGPTAFVALYGGTRLFRATAILLLTALKLAGLGVTAVMEADEASARAWLARKQRTRSG